MSKSEEIFFLIMEVSYWLFVRYGIIKMIYFMIVEEVGIVKLFIYYYFKFKDVLIECIFIELCVVM